jgi:hypothetical protein
MIANLVNAAQNASLFGGLVEPNRNRPDRWPERFPFHCPVVGGLCLTGLATTILTASLGSKRNSPDAGAAPGQALGDFAAAF